MQNLRRLILLSALFSAVFSGPVKAGPADFGLTPSHVYSLWTNVNNAVLAMSPVLSKDAGLSAELASMPQRSYSGKKPVDVLKRALEFKRKLASLRARHGLSAFGGGVVNSGKITPSIVYLNTGGVLGGTVDLLIRKTAPDQLVSQFYTRHEFSGKSPSDVFGLVDLANRRLDRIMERSSSGKV